MCEELKDELKKGQNAAIALAEHLDRMSAAQCKRKVFVNGKNYICECILLPKNQKIKSQ